ncbi:ornithine carbamoyltransferase [Horticoccus luteus]|uniref:Ornithine carbamoyltransferase n=1 Tax=Horticoccus luteus TaxID=2862869 RepID=A0A8F9TWD3_9BACT|nr:ornithine carbamoyltransferase [Horticoccus luteus]QYM79340.1 ornithine carbamoyltransferase [Horticoccus luteus]
MKHFLKETDFSRAQAAEVLTLAREFKQNRGQRLSSVLAGQTWAMIFSKSSTRTRVSFDVGIHELGGHPLFLNKSDIQLGRGETIEDTARVLSRFIHGLVVRTYDHADLERLAASGTIPVINALTDFLHPCQIYTDAFTAAERWAGPGGDLLESLRGRKIAYLGDTAFNMANSWILGASLFDMKLSLGGPADYAPGEAIRGLLRAEGRPIDFHFTTDAYEAVADADIVYTDVWASMGQEDESNARAKLMERYAVTEKLFAAAKPDALFMHCLPAHAGEEVAQAVLDHPRCVIFDEAENRLHTQKAIMAVLAKAAR